MRPLLERAYEELKKGLIPIVVAPTGYGKTRASPEILSIACSEEFSCSLIHIAPLRSLVYSIYKDNFEAYGGAYQMHDPTPAGDKSPYYLRNLVVTTIDSYIWNLYRIPVTEFSVIEKRLTGGHYYPIYTSIFTSINVFDEAHLYLGAGDPNLNYAAVRASISTLVSVGTPAIIETATLSSSRIEEIYGLVRESGGDSVVIELSCGNNSIIKYNKVNSVRIEDRDWIDYYRFHWNTYLTAQWDYVIDDMIRDSDDGIVLAVTNTVRNAVKLYKKIANRYDLDNIYLIHGRLSDKDRRKVEETVRNIGKGIIIGTPIIEAGIDVNAVSVYTELAPIENIVQRVGRACRRDLVLDKCRKNGGKVTIIVDTTSVEIYSSTAVNATLKHLKIFLNKNNTNIDWRTPCSDDNTVSYIDLIERVSYNQSSETSSLRDLMMTNILEKYLQKDMGPFGLLELLDESDSLCTLFRNTIMIQVLTLTGLVTTSLKWVMNNAKDLLEWGESNAPLIALLPIEGSSSEIIAEGEATSLWKLWSSRRPESYSCRRLNRALLRDIEKIIYNNNIDNRRFIWAFKAKKSAYTPKLGLLISKEKTTVIS